MNFTKQRVLGVRSSTQILKPAMESARESDSSHAAPAVIQAVATVPTGAPKRSAFPAAAIQKKKSTLRIERPAPKVTCKKPSR